MIGGGDYMALWQNLLKGNKTFIVAGIAILYAVSGLIAGNIDTNTAVQTVLGALGLAGIRSALNE